MRLLSDHLVVTNHTSYRNPQEEENRVQQISEEGYRDWVESSLLKDERGEGGGE